YHSVHISWLQVSEMKLYLIVCLCGVASAAVLLKPHGEPRKLISEVTLSCGTGVSYVINKRPSGSCTVHYCCQGKQFKEEFTNCNEATVCGNKISSVFPPGGINPGRPFPTINPGWPFSFPSINPGRPFPTIKPGRPFPTISFKEKYGHGKCAKECSLFIDMMICGSDGKTYDNRCKFEVDQCENPKLAEKYNGPCLNFPETGFTLPDWFNWG
ncbi:unnamed protein product, partial [Meganyctiphanes norvegica]